MWVLGVGGTSSNVGKTALVCRLLEGLPGWGALKTSVRKPGDPRPGHRHGRTAPADLCSDRDRLLRPGTDTERFAHAGATRVLWLRADLDALAGAIGPALGAFEGLPGVVVEGNSFAAFARPHRFVILARAGLDDVKGSAVPLVRTADWVAVQVARDASAASGRRLAVRLRERYGARDVRIVDLADPAEPIVTEIISWARSSS